MLFWCQTKKNPKQTTKNILESDPLGVNGLCNETHLFGLQITLVISAQL